ncbi:MAG TPA: glycosyltransferase family 9 protein, partial [Bacteroidota bacterium]
PLLAHNPLLDRVYLWEPESWLILQRQKFDVVMNVDKSLRSGAFAMSLNAHEKLGFGTNENGVIIPLNPEAEENYRLGLDDHFKFHVNQKTVPQLQCEEFRLTWARDEYMLNLTGEEKEFCRQYREENGIGVDEVVVGFNTGCSELYPNKKLTVEQHVTLIERLRNEPGIRLALLGGPEDTLRNAEIMRRTGGEAVLSTPTHEGLRRGICYENVCDVVVTGDSFGMHLAIGLKKFVIAWFGLSCWTEIDLFDRGIKLFNPELPCSPCWKKDCPFNLECIQLVDLDRIVAGVLSFRDTLIPARESSG